MRKKRFLRILPIAALCLLSGMYLSAQQKLQYWGDSDAMLQEQASLLFEQAYKVLDAYPPGTSANWRCFPWMPCCTIHVWTWGRPS